MRIPCTFKSDTDSCQGTDISRCTYCGRHEGTECGQNFLESTEKLRLSIYKKYGKVTPDKFCDIYKELMKDCKDIYELFNKMNI